MEECSLEARHSVPKFSVRGFAAGLVAGATGTLVGHPFDTLKLRRQVGCSEPRSLAHLLRGIALPVATAGALQCVHLGVYFNTLTALGNPPPRHGASPWYHVFTAGAVGGVVISPATCALRIVKVRQQLHGSSAQVALREIVSARGWRGLLLGYPLHCAMESQRGVYMLVFFLMKRWSGGEPVSLPYRVLSGATAGTVSWAIIYPADSVLSMLHSRAADPGGGARLTARACAAAMWREGGVRRFYRGFTYTLVRAGPVAAAVLTTYDLALDRLRRWGI
eukprot:TRINITY_DN51136_c0_g1_i1.p1 TRINITY_DN51136_c0_g1~~TRINITY_DN51136_c0_g1_i1.p1  ORF type:complete len:278 (+),score=49.46 TRINITY_DN51136_c0_g1_i1:75-908(+)